MTSTDTQHYVPVGEGMAHLPGNERTTGRFGCISLVATDYTEACHFDDAPVGQHGWLVAELLSAGHSFVLGQGTLFLDHTYFFQAIGLVPDDGRAECWLDPAELGQIDERLIRLLFVPDGEAQ